MGKIILLLITISIITCANVWGQMDSSYLHHSSRDPDPNIPEWELTLDVIKAKTEALMLKNNKLVEERNQLMSQYRQQQETIHSWQTKNAQLREFLKQRHGRSDEDVKIDEIKDQIKQKKAQLKDMQEQLSKVAKQAQAIDEKSRLKKLKISDLQLGRSQQDLQKNMQSVVEKEQASQDSDVLKGLKQQLQQQKEQEEALEGQLKDLKYNQMSATAAPPVPDEGQLKALEVKVEDLRKQKEDLQNRINGDNNQTNLHRYQDLMARKAEIQEKIKDFENQLSQLNKLQSSGLMEGKPNKQLVKQMAQWDSRNARLRQKITSMKEDITLLKTQVRRLERKITSDSNSIRKTK